MNVKEILKSLEEKYSLTNRRPLLGGHQSNHLYAYSSPELGEVVVKFGNEDEMSENIRGYAEIRNIGMTQILPNPLKLDRIGDSTVLIMENLGQTFGQRARQEKDLPRLYGKLLRGAEDIYTRTARDTTERGFEIPIYFNLLKELLDETAGQCLEGVISEDEKRFIQGIEIKNDFPKYCFSVFDFTPDNVFVNNGVFKFIDPKGIVRGVPVIDLAAFAGCARDANNLPGSQEGYRAIREFSRGYLRGLLELTEEKEDRLWNYGRGIQMLLGARFRMEDTKTTGRFLDRAIKYFEKAT